MSIQQWTFIGAGNMASSLVGGLIGSGHAADAITVVDINEEATAKLHKQFAVNTASDISQTPPNSGVVIAVKPHIVETVCRELHSHSVQLVISVAAGVREQSIQTWLQPETAIVRCMPNTPALLGLGATALFANHACNNEHKHSAEQLLKSAGITVWVEEENQLDAVTALSGSGPAYFFNLIEHMVSAAEELGLPTDVATNLAIETAYGAASMARQRSVSPSTLRKNVTSKGGTTAAALAVFEQQQFKTTVAKAMQAAKERAVELGDEFAT